MQEYLEHFIDVVETNGGFTGLGSKAPIKNDDIETALYNTSGYWACMLMNELNIPTTKFGRQHKHSYDKYGNIIMGGDIVNLVSIALFYQQAYVP